MVCYKMEDLGVTVLEKVADDQVLEVVSWKEALFHSHLLMDEKGFEILLVVIHRCLLCQQSIACVVIRHGLKDREARTDSLGLRHYC